MNKHVTLILLCNIVRNSLFVECFAEYVNAKLQKPMHQFIFFCNCICLFIVHVHHFSSLFKWINVFNALFFCCCKEWMRCSCEHSTQKLVFVEYFLNYKSELNSEPYLRGKHIDWFSTKQREIERWGVIVMDLGGVPLYSLKCRAGGEGCSLAAVLFSCDWPYRDECGRYGVET